MNKILSFQEFLRPAIRPVLGNKDYDDLERLLTRIDRILYSSGVERLFVEMSMESFEANAAKMEAAGEIVLVGPMAIERYQRRSVQALRCNVLKSLVGVGCREMSKQLALCPFYRWFCRLKDF